jgi:ADP-heptose:LPS heptosyltransferase
VKKKIEKTKKFFDKNNFNVVIGAGSSGPDTRWGEKNFIKLINQLNDKGKFFFLYSSWSGSKKYYA